MLRKDFDEFLFAPAGNDPNGTPMTVLTVLARLGLDPWEEAADLAHLSREPALKRLASRLEAVPKEPTSAADTVDIATRLIALLHRAPPRKAALPDVPPTPSAVTPPKSRNLAIYWLVGLGFLFLAQWALSSRPDQPPMDTTISQDTRR
jgi:hypothetical protein